MRDSLLPRGSEFHPAGGGVAQIRLMRESDADAVRELDADAFCEWEKRIKGEKAFRYLRTRGNVLMCREHDPEGCFVAEEDGRLVGFIFSRTWGGVGWFGTFAVLPQYQQRGIGKQLIGEALDYLRRDSDRIIGLETMAESPYNLGLYVKLGFEVRFPTLMLSKALEGAAAGAAPGHWSSADEETRKRWLTDLREATAEVLPGLDYSKEILSTERHGLGDTLVLTAGAKAVGMSTVWLVSACENWGEERASVRALALHPAHTDEATLHVLLTASEELARAQQKKALGVAVSACHPWALEQLLRSGYRVRGMAVHMVLRGSDDGPKTDRWVDLSRWAG